MPLMSAVHLLYARHFSSISFHATTFMLVSQAKALCVTASPLHRIALHLHCICTASALLHCVSPIASASHCITLHRIASHCIALHCIASVLHCVSALHHLGASPCVGDASGLVSILASIVVCHSMTCLRGRSFSISLTRRGVLDGSASSVCAWMCTLRGQRWY